MALNCFYPTKARLHGFATHSPSYVPYLLELVDWAPENQPPFKLISRVGMLMHLHPVNRNVKILKRSSRRGWRMMLQRRKLLRKDLVIPQSISIWGEVSIYIFLFRPLPSNCVLVLLCLVLENRFLTWGFTRIGWSECVAQLILSNWMIDLAFHLNYLLLLTTSAYIFFICFSLPLFFRSWRTSVHLFVCAATMHHSN